MSHTFLDRAVWDQNAGEIRDGEIRYLMIRSDALMSMFRRLPDDVRRQALAAFAASVFEHGGRSAQKYRELGAAQAEQLLQMIVDTAPQLGWGRWRFEQNGITLHLTVINSPFAAGFGLSDQPVCTPIVGMLQAVAELIYGQSCLAQEHNCAAQGHESCILRAVCGSRR